MRGIGIVAMDVMDDVPVALAVDLGARAERMPEPAFRTLLDISVPAVAIDARTPSAAAKVRLALRERGA